MLTTIESPMLRNWLALTFAPSIKTATFTEIARQVYLYVDRQSIEDPTMSAENLTDESRLMLAYYGRLCRERNEIGSVWHAKYLNALRREARSDAALSPAAVELILSAIDSPHELLMQLIELANCAYSFNSIVRNNNESNTPVAC